VVRGSKKKSFSSIRRILFEKAPPQFEELIEPSNPTIISSRKKRKKKDSQARDITSQSK
jgi:hypothetical protein